MTGAAAGLGGCLPANRVPRPRHPAHCEHCPDSQVPSTHLKWQSGWGCWAGRQPSPSIELDVGFPVTHTYSQGGHVVHNTDQRWGVRVSVGLRAMSGAFFTAREATGRARSPGARWACDAPENHRPHGNNCSRWERAARELPDEGPFLPVLRPAGHLHPWFTPNRPAWAAPQRAPPLRRLVACTLGQNLLGCLPPGSYRKRGC